MKGAAFLMAAGLLLAVPVQASEQASSGHGGGGEKAADQPPAATRLEIPDDYCANIADKARDARYQLQAATLAELQKKLEEETARLEKKRAEVEVMLKKRDDEMNKARRELVDIYAKMKPDAAAIQLSLLTPETSASVMRQLKPAGASAILTEMKPEIAAAIAALLAQQPDETDATPKKEQGS